jgi:hypothetical protein
MSRIVLAVLSVLALAVPGASGALAQAGCQPTLTEPCAKPPNKPPNKPGNQPSQPTNAARTDDTNEPIDHSARIKVDRDTDFKFGTGGIGLGRKF